MNENEQKPLGLETEAAQVWTSFTRMLQGGDVSSIRIRPYYPTLHESLQRFLQNLWRNVDWKEWVEQPETHIVENQVHFLLGLTQYGDYDTFCFSFLVEDEEWYFQHVENITLRLDQLGPLPTNHFPDLSEAKKAWIREETEVSKMVRLYQWLVQEKGSSFALDWFQDGEGYALGAKTWVPFVPAHRAFILYLCWEQANLRGSSVTLIELSDTTARIHIEPLYFKLYQQAGHLILQISFDDYRCLFETIWADRARKASWQEGFTYQNEMCDMEFRRYDDENAANSSVA
jgi:hypothetical protein